MADDAKNPPSGTDRGALEIVAEDVHRSFGGREVLHGITLSIFAGEMVAIVGASGSGKTVLLDHLTGLLTPDGGRVLVADHSRAGSPLVDLNQITEDELDEIRLSWAVVFQRNALFSGTVFENIALWLREHTALDEAAIAARVRESLAAVALEVDDVISKQREALSGGMAKRVAIARAIAVDPRVLFYDEPTTGLDPVVGAHVHELVWKMHHRVREDGSKRTTVIVTHDKDLLRRIEPHIIMLDHGAVCFRGTYAEFQVSDVPAAKMYLAAMPVLHARDVQ